MVAMKKSMGANAATPRRLALPGRRSEPLPQPRSGNPHYVKGARLHFTRPVLARLERVWGHRLRNHAAGLRRSCRARLAPEDAVQRALLRLSCGHINAVWTHPNSDLHYALKVVRNLYLDAIGCAAERHETLECDLGRSDGRPVTLADHSAAATVVDPEGQYEATLALQALALAFEWLPHFLAEELAEGERRSQDTATRDLKIFRLFEISGHDKEEVAAALGLPHVQNTWKSRGGALAKGWVNALSGYGSVDLCGLSYASQFADGQAAGRKFVARFPGWVRSPPKAGDARGRQSQPVVVDLPQVAHVADHGEPLQHLDAAVEQRQAFVEVPVGDRTLAAQRGVL